MVHIVKGIHIHEYFHPNQMKCHPVFVWPIDSCPGSGCFCMLLYKYVCKRSDDRGDARAAINQKKVETVSVCNSFTNSFMFVVHFLLYVPLCTTILQYIKRNMANNCFHAAPRCPWTMEDMRGTRQAIKQTDMIIITALCGKWFLGFRTSKGKTKPL